MKETTKAMNFEDRNKKKKKNGSQGMLGKHLMKLCMSMKTMGIPLNNKTNKNDSQSKS